MSRAEIYRVALAEIARLTVEVERLTEQLRLTQIDWNNVATENDSLQTVVDAARKLIKNSGAESLDELRLSQAIRALDGEP